MIGTVNLLELLDSKESGGCSVKKWKNWLSVWFGFVMNVLVNPGELLKKQGESDSSGWRILSCGE